MIADGCGYNHIDAASLYQHGRTGTPVYAHFPVQLGMSTYPYGGGYDPAAAWEDFDHVREGTTDSAAAATAMSTGMKTYRGAIGVAVDRASLNVLDNDADGFVLMVEGGAVDWGAHDNRSGRMIEEEIDFNRAVEAGGRLGGAKQRLGRNPSHCHRRP